MLFPSVGVYMLKNTKEITKKIFFPIIPMGAKRYIVVRVVKSERRVG